MRAEYAEEHGGRVRPGPSLQPRGARRPVVGPTHRLARHEPGRRGRGGNADDRPDAAGQEDSVVRRRAAVGQPARPDRCAAAREGHGGCLLVACWNVWALTPRRRGSLRGTAAGSPVAERTAGQPRGRRRRRAGRGVSRRSLSLFRAMLASLAELPQP